MPFSLWKAKEAGCPEEDLTGKFGQFLISQVPFRGHFADSVAGSPGEGIGTNRAIIIKEIYWIGKRRGP
jgi:hypothetical protein